MKYYIIAGEASGDKHTSHLARSIHTLDTSAQIYGWGGDLMVAAGVNLRKHYRDTAFMGFLEVLKHLPEIKRNFDFCKKDILAFHPDVLVLVDYPGFNLRIAKWAKKKGYKVVYYISPQVWAWKAKRVESIRKYVDRLITILPFEKAFYKSYQLEVDFVGHPLFDEMATFKKDPDFYSKHKIAAKPLMALLPGSRKQEIKRMLPVMISACKEVEDMQFALAVAPSIELDFYQKILDSYSSFNISLVQNDMYQLLAHADFAMVTSGTATLETALFGVPQIVCYKSDYFSFWIAKKLVQLDHISLVNLIMDEEIIPELIQGNCKTETIVSEYQQLQSPEMKTELEKKYNLLKKKLGGQGASIKAANIIHKIAYS